ncbi:hypothetical protein QQY75_02665 [Streptococcus suis]|uniref:Uncharacterized protein n=1 Tax=Streptococcus suis 6407 TaxID=1214179 RepID=A0A075SM06_STRSU|nr:hypothetical protein [Streptococcus suis]AIG44411.1 hypothetical protein ID09_10405 [Streptococcus suis 6407]MBS7850296.1 hypothetical protein [Streptococcus suis]MBS7864382.1 hypothetical protein [Streptococcus suis]MCK3951583.1 hypothetical protein [Streptococcus suis]MCK4056591.1 hypothetical protein [Streptococcus suis]
MALFGSKQSKVDAQKQKYYSDALPYFEENGMVEILEKYPEQAAYIGNVLSSKTIALANATGPGAFEKVQIQQNQIIIQQNEEIIALLKNLSK